MTQQNITLNMIVKNEAHCIHNSLSTVYKYINYYVIADTGSTDNTKEVIKSFFDGHGISGEIHDIPWRNFGWNRTEAFKCAKGKGDYVWVIDADDKICGNLVLPELLQQDSYCLRYECDHGPTLESWWRPQIFNNALDWRYEGVLHEYAVCEEAKISEQIKGDYHLYPTYAGDRNKAGVAVKMKRDAEILKKELQADPDNLRNVFYLAQSYFVGGEHAKALEWYVKRAEAGGWEEEVYVSLWRKAVCHGVVTGKIPFQFLIDAHEYRPHRLEAPYELIRSCREQKKFHSAYAWAKNIFGRLTSFEDMLFVNPEIAAWRLQDELSICAYWVGKYIESKELCLSLLEGAKLPLSQKERVRANLRFALAKLGE